MGVAAPSVASASSTMQSHSSEQRLMFASFIPGYLAVDRIGNGTALVGSGKTNPLFIDEFNPAGSTTQSPLISVALPTAAGTGNTPNPLTVTNSFGEGLLSLSTDGHYLVVPGYADTPNDAIVAATSGVTNFIRTVGRISNSGNIDTTTTANNMGTGNFRGVTSSDGSGFWASTSTSGVIYVPYGGTGGSGVQISTTATGNPVNTRAVTIFNGQLYVDALTGTTTPLIGPGTVGTGLPQTGLVSITELNGFPTSTAAPANNPAPSPFQFVFKDANTIYVADAGITGSAGIQKWTQSGGTWTLQYNTLAAASGNADAGIVRRLTMDANGVPLCITTTNTTGNRFS